MKKGNKAIRYYKIHYDVGGWEYYKVPSNVPPELDDYYFWYDVQHGWWEGGSWNQRIKGNGLIIEVSKLEIAVVLGAKALEE
jgi:hypothetical protein